MGELGNDGEGQLLIQIELTEVCAKPRIERLNGKLKVITSSTFGIDQLLEEFGDLMHPQEKIDLVKLWRDDNTPRNFEVEPGKLIITFKEML